MSPCRPFVDGLRSFPLRLIPSVSSLLISRISRFSLELQASWRDFEMRQRHLCFLLSRKLRICFLILSGLCFLFLNCRSGFVLSPLHLLSCARSASLDSPTCQSRRSRLRTRGLPIQLGSHLPLRAYSLRWTPTSSLSALPPQASSPLWQRPSSSLPAFSPHLVDSDRQPQPPQLPKTALPPPLTPQTSNY